jgi:hypothetical protein
MAIFYYKPGGKLLSAMSYRRSAFVAGARGAEDGVHLTEPGT